MKYIYQTLITLFFILFAFSCSLDRDPYDFYKKEDLEKDKEEAVKYLLTGSYSQLKKWSDEMHRIGEYPGDNVMIRGSSTDAFYSFISYAHVKDNGRITTFWTNSYRAIAQASDVLKMLPAGENVDHDNSLGEAYYIRGMVYFYLTNVFGRPYYQSPETNLGVPIVLNGTPSKPSEMETPDRSTVKDCYEQVIRDLRRAEKLLTKENTAAYATKEAAQAMLSRVYLYMSGTYESPNVIYADSAIYYANEVIKSERFKLLSRDNFMIYNQYAPDDKAQTETIFAIKRVKSEFSGSDYYYGIGGMYANILGQGWGEMYATSKYMDLLKKAGYKKDARWAFIDPQYEMGKDGNTKTPSFRFITDLINKDGVQTGYTYIQDTLWTKTDGTHYIREWNADKTAIAATYPLTLVDAGEKLYSINYAGKIRIGELDDLMILNRIYPMFYITKCSLQEGESHLYSPIISRYAELYLNMAEAYAKKGDYPNARINVNIIRERSVEGGGYTSLDFDATNAKRLINEERQLELAFEAQRAYDVYRNGENMERRYPGPHNAMADVEATSNRVIHYIPQKEINAYPGPLTQNPD